MTRPRSCSNPWLINRQTSSGGLTNSSAASPTPNRSQPSKNRRVVKLAPPCVTRGGRR